MDNIYQKLLDEISNIDSNEVPVCAAIVRNGKIISIEKNTMYKDYNVHSHAEILAINKAFKKLNTTKLNDCELYSTLDPCFMCFGAIVNSRIKKINIICKKNEYDLEQINYILNAKIKIEYAPEKYGITVKETLSDFFKKIRENMI